MLGYCSLRLVLVCLGKIEFRFTSFGKHQCWCSSVLRFLITRLLTRNGRRLRCVLRYSVFVLNESHAVLFFPYIILIVQELTNRSDDQGWKGRYLLISLDLELVFRIVSSIFFVCHSDNLRASIVNSVNNVTVGRTSVLYFSRIDGRFLIDADSGQSASFTLCAVNLWTAVNRKNDCRYWRYWRWRT